MLDYLPRLEERVLDPRAEYRTRLTRHVKLIEEKERRHIAIGNLKLAVVAALLVLGWLCFPRAAFSAYWLLVPVATYAILGVLHELTIRTRTRSETAAAFYQRGFARMEDRWSGTGATGERFRDAKHVYAEDLDLFGRGCLFELLSTAKLPMGESRLADWLLAPSPVLTILDRQSFVDELRDKLDLREDLGVMGEVLRVRLNPESLIKWCEAAPTLGGTAWRPLAAALAVAAAASLVYFFLTLVVWPFLATLIFEAMVNVWLRKRAGAVISGVSSNAEGVELFSEIVERLENEPFVSPRLRQLAAELIQGPEPASRAIRRFARIVYWMDSSDSLIAKLLNLPFLYTVQVALAAEAWRRRHGKRMGVWIDVVAEFEALLSLATYSFEHPADPFPEFASSDDCAALFDGASLGHPLLPAAQCVPNSVRLDASARVWIVSGSNMSGKSTLLRTIGINAVLAMAGAPIRGKSLRLTSLSLGTRLRSIDSLQEGRSTFYTELLRIRQVFDLASGERPILFLFDELLDGTNSHDRRIGAENLVRALLECGSIGALTTHDLALAEMTRSLGSVVHNAHFEDHVEDGKMRFDYKLREGVVTKSNALELMRLVGLKV